MPIALAIGAVVVGGVGVVAAVEAKEDFELAKYIGDNSKEKYDQAASALGSERTRTNNSFEKLGKEKIKIFSNQINHFIDVCKRIKSTRASLKDFQFEISTEDLKEMEALVVGSLRIENSLASGAAAGALAGVGALGAVTTLGAASTGTAIASLSGAAATNATLAWFGGGSLAAGGMGMSVGACALGGIVLAPVLFVSGFIMSEKADKALTKAREYEATVDIEVGKMAKLRTVMLALQEHGRDMGSALGKLASRYDSIKENDPSEEKFSQMTFLSKSILALLRQPLIKDDGTPIPGIKTIISGHLSIV